MADMSNKGKREGVGRPPSERTNDDPMPRLLRVYASKEDLAYISSRLSPKERTRILMQYAKLKAECP
jgi:hypothetical protein